MSELGKRFHLPTGPVKDTIPGIFLVSCSLSIENIVRDLSELELGTTGSGFDGTVEDDGNFVKANYFILDLSDFEGIRNVYFEE